MSLSYQPQQPHQQQRPQQQQLNEQLFSAIESYNNTLIERALLNGADINAHSQTRQGNTPLIEAIGLLLSELAIYLINHGANINAQNEDGETPLMSAVGNDMYDVTIYLINRGANINAQDKQGITPLMVAAEYEMLNLAIHLIDYGAGVNAQNLAGDTALTMAISQKDSEMVRLLLARGATYPIETLRYYIKNGDLYNLRKVLAYGILIPPEVLQDITDPKMLKLVEPCIQTFLGKRGLDNPIVTSTKRPVNYDIALLEDYIITNDYNGFEELLLTSPLIRDKLKSSKFRYEIRRIITQLNDGQNRSNMLALI